MGAPLAPPFLFHSGGLFNEAGSNATGANADALDVSIRSYVANSLQIRVPYTLCLVVCMADIIAYTGHFPTDLALPAHTLGSFLIQHNVSLTNFMRY